MLRCYEHHPNNRLRRRQRLETGLLPFLAGLAFERRVEFVSGVEVEVELRGLPKIDDERRYERAGSTTSNTTWR